MNVFFEYAWVFLIGVTVLNYFLLKVRVQPYIDQNPQLKPGYDKMLKALLIYGNLPWLLIAIGNITGQTTSVWNYFNPRSFNPFVLAFHFSIVLIWILLIRWIYFKKGAEFLIKHPGIFIIKGFGKTKNIESALSLKLLLALMLLGGIMGLTMMWMGKIPHLQQ